MNDPNKLEKKVHKEKSKREPWGRWNRFLSRASIRQQLYVIYFVAVVVPILLIGSFLVGNTYKILVNYHSDLLESDNLRVRNILYEITAQIYNISEEITFHDDVQGVLTGRYGEREWYYEAIDSVNVLDSYENNYTEIQEIQIYTDNPYVEDYKQLHRITPEIRKQDWYQKAESQSAVFWTEMQREDAYGNIYWNLCLVRKIPLINTRYRAVMVIKVSDDYLRTRIDTSQYENLVSAEDGCIFYCSDRKMYGKKLPLTVDYEEPYYQYLGREEMNGKQCFVSIFTLHPYQAESRLYISTINAEGYKSIRYIQGFCVVILALAMLIPGLIIYFFTNYFTGRVNVLRQEMHKASNQDYELIPTFQGNDELTEAFGDLQVMVQNIKEQEAKIYSTQINEQELMIQQQSMEFKMLSSQINPHFLYNTLETIRMKAFTAGDREVATAIKLLGKSMRYVLENTGTTVTTLREEIAHVENYMQIQKLRFENRINYEICVAEDVNLEEYKILPLLLQPVVENAIIHGLEDDEREGHIKISICRKTEQMGELLMIEVEDNGDGMDEQTLQILREDIEVKDMTRSKSIGLYNINQRIKLHYGEDFGIKIYSELAKGTTVRLQFPVETMKKDSILI